MVDRASETLRLVGQSCILRIPVRVPTHRPLPLSISARCAFAASEHTESHGSATSSTVKRTRPSLSRSDDGDGETNPVQGMVPNDDHKCAAWQPFCAARMSALLIDETRCVKKSSWGLSARRQSFVEEEFARVADTCHDVDVSPHAVVDNDLYLRASKYKYPLGSKSLRSAAVRSGLAVDRGRSSR